MKMTNSKQRGFTIVEVFTLIFLLAMPIGWCMNIYKFASCDFKAPVKAEVLRGIGIPIWPMGVIIGYMDIDDAPKEQAKDFK